MMTLPHGVIDQWLEKIIKGHASMRTLYMVLMSGDSTSASIEYATIVVEVQGKLDLCTRPLPVAGMSAYAGDYTNKQCQLENSGTCLRIWTPV